MIQTDNEILFTEKQYFRQWWLWVILLGVNGLFLYGAFTQVIGSEPFGDNPMSNLGIFFTCSLILLITILFVTLRLDTQVKKDGLYIRFFPFQLAFRFIDWAEIDKAYIRQYNPLMEYGGWGFRFGLMGKGTAFNVSGSVGLQLELKDGKKVLIGTNKPDELSIVLLQNGKLTQ